MDKLKKAIESIGRDIGTLQANQGGALQTTKAYELFPTYATLQAQMTTNIKEKHVDLGLDALIDTKLANGGDPFVTRSKLPTIDTSQLASKKRFGRVEAFSRFWKWYRHGIERPRLPVQS